MEKRINPILKRSIERTPAFPAGDETIIREVLHPYKEKIELPYSLAFATLAAGCSSLPHLLEDSSEVFVFIQGKGRIFINGENAEVKAGDVVLVPKGARQYLKNEGDSILSFWC